MLLVLDGFEHVIDAASDVAALIAAAEGPCVLVTSREPLHLWGETEYPLDPMALDEAVDLFGDRARAVLPSFDAAAESDAVTALCARLDGLPLAIELAAARVKLFSPSALLERLEQGLDVLSCGIRGVPERQRTLEATIEWSYRLLRDDERVVFERASVFRDGARLDALEQVCGATMDVVASLVDKSLLRHVAGWKKSLILHARDPAGFRGGVPERARRCRSRASSACRIRRPARVRTAPPTSGVPARTTAGAGGSQKSS